MLQRTHYRKTSVRPGMCRFETRRVSLKFEYRLGMWDRSGMFVVEPTGVAAFARSPKGS